MLLCFIDAAHAQSRPRAEEPIVQASPTADLQEASSEEAPRRGPQLRGRLVNEIVADAVRRERAQQPSAQSPNNNRRWLKWLLIGAGAAAAWILVSRSLVPYT